MRVTGTVQKWFNDKGFGFIAVPGEKKNVFVHYKEIRKNDPRERVELRDGEQVELMMTHTDKGMAAQDVVRLG